jgi:hypothetical protein
MGEQLELILKEDEEVCVVVVVVLLDQDALDIVVVVTILLIDDGAWHEWRLVETHEYHDNRVEEDQLVPNLILLLLKLRRKKQQVNGDEEVQAREDLSVTRDIRTHPNQKEHY